MPEPEFSVVIPVRDGAHSLPKLLESLGRQTMSTSRFEVIVVDNGSRDDTAAIAARAGAHVVQLAEPSRARARNAGAAVAVGRVFAFTDADCVVAPGWLEAFAACAGSAPLLAGRVEVTTGDPPNDVERFERLWRFEQEAWAEHLGWAATANLMVERTAFEAIEGFDVAYRHTGEDVDFCIRAGRRGFGIRFCPGADAHHEGESRMWPMLKRAFWHGYGSVQVARRIGGGHRAWTSPKPLFDSSQAASMMGIDRSRTGEADWSPMRRLARRAYAMRVLGSLWADLRRAR
jgi:glycosyltransferase involved in cell wall biosynthesis